MTASNLLPSKHQSNIYDAREVISDKLNELLTFRLNLEHIKHSSSDVEYCENLLKLEHRKFTSIKTMIELSEKVSFQFGGLQIADTSFISI